MPSDRPSLEERFWAKVNRSATRDGCWIWNGGRNAYGYGLIYEGRKAIQAHRLSYELHFSPLAQDQIVSHRCDNPACVNPAHLVAGTQSDNIRDAIRKGRFPQAFIRGEMKPGHKLSVSSVRIIRRYYAAGGISQVELGRIFGVSDSLVSRVVRQLRWTHV